MCLSTYSDRKSVRWLFPLIIVWPSGSFNCLHTFRTIEPCSLIWIGHNIFGHFLLDHSFWDIFIYHLLDSGRNFRTNSIIYFVIMVGLLNCLSTSFWYCSLASMQMPDLMSAGFITILVFLLSFLRIIVCLCMRLLPLLVLLLGVFQFLFQFICKICYSCW